MSGLPSSLCESVPRGSRGTEYSSVVWAAGMPARSRSDQHAHVLFASYYNVQRHPLQAVLRRVRFGQYHGPCPERAFRAVCHLHFSVLFTSMVRCLLCSSLLLAYCVLRFHLFCPFIGVGVGTRSRPHLSFLVCPPLAAYQKSFA